MVQTDVRKIITRIACRFLRGIFVKSDRLLATGEYALAYLKPVSGIVTVESLTVQGGAR